ncbi:MAG TPA: helix-turn-helix domain-containing protein [Chitinophagaceae bacterium]
MKHWYQQPHPLIAGYIRTVLILEGAAEPSPSALPLFTNAMPALFCKTKKGNSGNESILQLTLFGKTVPGEYWTVHSDETIIAYFFKPFALASSFNIAASILNEKAIDLDNWNPHTTNALKMQLIYAISTAKKTEVLDNFLLQQLQQRKRECEIIQFVTDQIMFDPGTTILAEMLKKLNLTERTFQRIFKKYVGVTANQYRRICQFHISFAQLRSKDFDKLSDVAYDNGFADQSHFIRSFKEFTQITPAGYLKSGLKGKQK